jgi:hypothetical protein
VTVLQFFEQFVERVNCKLTGMTRGFRKAPDLLNQIFPLNVPSNSHAFALYQLSDRRSASHRRNAALGAESNLDDLARVQLRTQLENIAAGRIFQSHSRIRALKRAGISRVIKVIDQFW